MYMWELVSTPGRGTISFRGFSSSAHAPAAFPPSSSWEATAFEGSFLKPPVQVQGWQHMVDTLSAKYTGPFLFF